EAAAIGVCDDCHCSTPELCCTAARGRVRLVSGCMTVEIPLLLINYLRQLPRSVDRSPPGRACMCMQTVGKLAVAEFPSCIVRGLLTRKACGGSGSQGSRSTCACRRT